LNMKRFLYNVGLYLTIICLIVLAINWLYVKKAYNSNDVVPSDIKICNLGSSHGVHSYYYSDLESQYVCYNFALDSQSWSYDARILDYNQEKLAPGGVVIVDISYFNPWGQPETDEDDFESKNKRYYNILPPELIKEYDFYTDVMVNRLPSLNAGIDRVVMTVLSPKKNSDSKHLSYPEIDDKVDPSKLEEDAKATCQRHIFKNKRDDSGELIINQEEIQALYRIVEICKKQNVTPIFVTCPYLKEYTDEITSEDADFYDQFYNLINDIARQLGV